MLRLEYIANACCYRIYNISNPDKTVGYETDYYKALARIQQAENGAV